MNGRATLAELPRKGEVTSVHVGNFSLSLGSMPGMCNFLSHRRLR